MADPVRDLGTMLAALSPKAVPGDVVFCTTTDGAVAGAALTKARGVFAEAEGMSLILPLDVAANLGLPTGLPMRQITLGILSALDSVGLTAAVAGALAARGIPCNVVAAFHHDHLFVPADQKDTALAALAALKDGTR